MKFEPVFRDSFKVNGSGLDAAKPKAAAAKPAAAPGAAPASTGGGKGAFPTQPPPKVGKVQLVKPSYLKIANPSPTSPLLRNDKGLATTDALSFRAGADSRQVIRDYTRVSPDLSAAVAAYVRTGITDSYTAIAYNTADASVNPEATSALQQLMIRFDVLNDYTIGYDDSHTIRGLSEIWARELMTLGECAGELILDNALLPDKIVPITTQQIRLFPSTDATKRIPQQFIGGQYIPLDVPTFFMTRLDEDLTDPYSISPIEPAVQAVIFSTEFMNDVRRVVKRAIHPRVDVTIDEDKFLENAAPETRADQELLNEYLNSVIAAVQTQINGLAPEDALVHFESIGIKITDHGNTNLSKEYELIVGMADEKVAAGAKVLPTVLGKSDGTSNTASAEVMMFVKYVEGAVTFKLNEQFSKILTLGVRLLGYDVVVKFAYGSVNLKPKSELEAFEAMKQSRYLQLLSLGFVTDEECSIVLTGHLPPPGHTPLFGTNFYNGAPGAEPAGDGYNGASNSGSTLNQNQQSDAPTGVKGKNTNKQGTKQ